MGWVTYHSRTGKGRIEASTNNQWFVLDVNVSNARTRQMFINSSTSIGSAYLDGVPAGTRVRGILSGTIGGGPVFAIVGEGSMGENTSYSTTAWSNRSGQYADLTVSIQYYVAQPPLRPTSITIPDNVLIEGDSPVPITWGPASRANEYQLLRSINNEGYVAIYAGNERSFTDIISNEWQSVRYVVRGRNVDGYGPYLYSDTHKIEQISKIKNSKGNTLRHYIRGWAKKDGAVVGIRVVNFKKDNKLEGGTKLVKSN